MLSTAASLGAPPAAAHAQLMGWLARVAQRPAVKREIAAMLAFAAALPRARASA